MEIKVVKFMMREYLGPLEEKKKTSYGQQL